ncbi:ACP S-malonyltransferase [Undibacterium sp. TJN19]|uniref:ACP S-malonyltransferase n=1 Tax=Undibacterium sp. TJN19 TaxID=3413055 RepID=UPI003BF17A4D
MNKFALLCPGQGAQTAEMFDLATASLSGAAFLKTLDDSDVFSLPLTQVLASTELLFENRYAQPLIVAASLANWQVIRHALPAPALVAGYSVGEISAHAVSGSLDIQTAIHLAASRAQMMQACVTQSAPQRMLAVSGINIAELQVFASQHRLHVAIVTAENKAIIAGLADDIALAIPALQDMPGHDISHTIIPVHIASHTPLMQGAVPAFTQLLMQSPVVVSNTSVLAGVSAETVTTPEQICSSLVEQLTHPIQWAACMDACAEKGIRFALELGPGSALSTMLQARHPHIACRSVADFRSLDGVIAWVKRQLES